tara:strand:- start:241 stop:465 length:225 start_codon:yes stop_codon:yes gene_type:complete
MFKIDKTLQMVLIIYLFITFFVYQIKPNMLFTSQGEFKSFGTGPNKTIIPFWLVTLSVSLLVYIYINIKTDDFV